MPLLAVPLMLSGGCGRVGFDSHGLSMDAGAALDDSGRDGGGADAEVAGDGGSADAGTVFDAAADAGAGGALAGQLCAAESDCAAGLGCHRSGVASGVCTAFCTTTAECPSNTECVRSSGVPAGQGLCTAVCEPLMNEGCPPELGCHFVAGYRVEDGAEALITVCGPATGPATGEACTVYGEPGNFCIGGVCERICLWPGGACPGATSCGRLTPRAALGSVEYGSCY